MQQISLTFAGVTFTFDNSVPGALIQQLNGWEMGGIRDVIRDVSNDDIATFVQHKMGRRIFSFDGVLIGSDRANWLARRKDLISIIPPMNNLSEDRLALLKFTTDDSEELQAYVVVNNVKMPMVPENYRHGPYSVEMIAPDSRFYEQAETDVTVVRNDDNVCSNIAAADGGVYVKPVFLITGPGDEFTITNATTGEAMVIDSVLAGGEFITVDVLNRTVLQDDGTNLYADFSGDWITLQPGDNEIHFDIGSADTAATELTVTYRKARKGI